MSASNDCSLLSYQDTFLSLNQDTNWFLVHSITSNNTTSTFYFFFLERERESQPTAFASNDYSLSSDHLIKSHQLFTLFLEHHINILLFFLEREFQPMPLRMIALYHQTKMPIGSNLRSLICLQKTSPVKLISYNINSLTL